MATYSRKRPASFDFEYNYTLLPVLPRSINTPKPSKQPPPKKPRLTQLTIDLGGATQKKCKDCGMEYVPSNTEDARLHKKFHDARVGGVDVPRALAGCAKMVYKCERCKPCVRLSAVAKQGSETEDVVVEIGRKDGQSARNAAVRVLQVVEEELGAVRTSEDDLWSQVSFEEFGNWEEKTSRSPAPAYISDKNEEDQRPASTKKGNLPQKHDRHKVYLYLQNNKCLGLCLAERIRAARPVLPCKSVDYGNIELSDERQPADMGISRIWVTREFRRASVAQRLLDAARKSFMSGRVIEKERVAFSQPTTSGARLARCWFEREDGWLVYNDELHRVE